MIKEGEEKGIEIITHIDDKIVKLLQPFPPAEGVAERHPKIVHNKRFETAALEYAQAANKSATTTPRLAPQVVESQEPEPAPVDPFADSFADNDTAPF